MSGSVDGSHSTTNPRIKSFLARSLAWPATRTAHGQKDRPRPRPYVAPLTEILSNKGNKRLNKLSPIESKSQHYTYSYLMADLLSIRD